MEKLFDNSYDKECLKIAMLKHEETFKQQVYELHRLYRVQKILMKNMEITKLKERSQEQHGLMRDNFNHYIPQRTRRNGFDLDRPCDVKESNIEILDESEIELTLGPSCYRKRPVKPLNSDSEAWSFSSSSTASSINRIKESKSAEAEMMQQERIKQQPWFVQVVSLNIT